MGASLGGHDGVDLIDDDGVDPAQAGGGVGSQEEIQRFRSGDQDLGRMATELASFLPRCVAGTDTDFRLMERNSGLPGHIRDAGQGGASFVLRRPPGLSGD